MKNNIFTKGRIYRLLAVMFVFLSVVFLPGCFIDSDEVVEKSHPGNIYVEDDEDTSRLLDPNPVSINLTKYYKIVSVHSGKVLDVNGVSKDNGANIHQWSYVGQQNQQWYFDPINSNTFVIRARHSKKVLTVQDASSENGANVYQWKYENNKNQKWRIEDAGNGSVFIKNINSGKVLDVSGASSNNGANVHQWKYVSQNNQKWKLIPVGNIKVVRTDEPYKIQSVLSGKVLEVASSDFNDGANIQQNAYSGGANQKWYFEKTDNGAYFIKSKLTSKLIDVAAAGVADNTNVLQWYNYGGDNQKWLVRYLGWGKVELLSVHTYQGIPTDYKRLAIHNNSVSDGANIVIFHNQANKNDDWRLKVDTSEDTSTNIIQKEVVDSKKVCDLGKALFTDQSFVFDELYNWGLDEKITWGTTVKNTSSGSRTGVLYGYLHNGSHQWVYYKKDLPLDSTLALFNILENASSESIDNWSRAQASSGKAILIYQATLLGKGNGFIIVDRHQNKVIENDVIYDASISSKKFKHTQSEDNVNLLHSTVYDVTYNSKSISFSEMKFCFVEGTKVTTKRGKINIENIKKGDMVLSQNTKNGKLLSPPCK